MSYYSQNRSFSEEEVGRLKDNMKIIIWHIVNNVSPTFKEQHAGAKAFVQLEGTNRLEIDVNIGNSGCCTAICGSNNSFYDLNEITEKWSANQMYTMIEHWTELKAQLFNQMNEIKSQRDVIFNFTV